MDQTPTNPNPQPQPPTPPNLPPHGPFPAQTPAQTHAEIPAELPAELSSEHRALADALRRASPFNSAATTPTPPPPPGFDERTDRAMLEHWRDSRARAFDQRLRTRRTVRVGAGLAAAAAIALAVFVALPFLRPSHPHLDQHLADSRSEQRNTPASESARLAELAPSAPARTQPVSILDAFELARLLRDEAPTDPARWDITGDGRIDTDDVDEFARRAVLLSAAANAAKPAAPKSAIAAAKAPATTKTGGAA